MDGTEAAMAGGDSVGAPSTAASIAVVAAFAGASPALPIGPRAANSPTPDGGMATERVASGSAEAEADVDADADADAGADVEAEADTGAGGTADASTSRSARADSLPPRNRNALHEPATTA